MAQAEATPSVGRPLPVLLIATVLPIAVTLVLHPLVPWFDGLASFFSLPYQPRFPALQANIGFGLLAFVGVVVAVPKVGTAFMGKGLKGRDLLKPGGRISGPWIPECLGLPSASIYVGLMMLFIPFPFSHVFRQLYTGDISQEQFPTGELALYLSSLLSLLTATMLGFIDDLFDIRWRHKLPIPIIAAVPTLVVYYAEGGLTSVVLPASAGKLLAYLGLPSWNGAAVVDLGFLYYVYLTLFPTFTTNSINILAGINGVEAIQPLIIASSVIVNDLLFLPIWPSWLLQWLAVGNAAEGRLLEWAVGQVVERHLMSLYFMIPLVGVCTGFLWHNWYPARAFPGDTFCYFAGMAFSAVAIQGHFSKTMLLFFIPQVFNFLLSCPQLFGLVDCPRHRLPSYNATSGLLEPSVVTFDGPPPLRTRITLACFERIGLTRLQRRDADQPTAGDAKPAQNRQIVSATNFTLINLVLVRLGPLHEPRLCLTIGLIQAMGSVMAFGIRYGIASLVYGGDRR